MDNIYLPIDQMKEAQKFTTYVLTRTGILDVEALFSDGTCMYRQPCEPMLYESVKIRLRTAKDNIDEAYIRTNKQRIKMHQFESDDMFDYYEGELGLEKELVLYYFEIRLGRLTVHYNKKGVSREPDHYYDYRIKPGFKTPSWAKGAVMYQIFADRFYNGDPTNDVLTDEYSYIGKKVTKVEDWKKYPAADGIREFYGGDLQGVIDKLDYLHELGVEAIYLNPIFVSPSNHKYDTQDYDSIDPHLGVITQDGGEVLPDELTDNEQAGKYIMRTTNRQNLEQSNQLFIKLVEAAHQKNIKIILDGVFNHCGSFNKWLDREKIYQKADDYPAGAFHSNGSPYYSFFHFYKKDAWPDNPNYDGWWGHDTLPKLNYEGSPKLYDYVMEIASRWVAPPYNADGWRLDVAADLGYTKEFNHKFWRDFRRSVKQANPNAIVLAEHYGDPTDWLIEGDQWDTVMNYDAFMEPVSWFLTGMEKHSEEFRSDLLGNHEAFFNTMRHNMAYFHMNSLMVAMNQLSNHDHSRFLTRTNHQVGRTHTMGAEAANQNINPAVMREAVVMQMTWVGAPTIYYGDEVGVCGWTDPDNRRTYPWGEEDVDLLELHKSLISIRKALPVLRTGSIAFLYGRYNIVAYGRFDRQEKVIVIVNNNDSEEKVEIPVRRLGIANDHTCQRVLETSKEGHSTNSHLYNVIKGKIEVLLKPTSSVIIRYKPNTY